MMISSTMLIGKLKPMLVTMIVFYDLGIFQSLFHMFTWSKNTRLLASDGRFEQENVCWESCGKICWTFGALISEEEPHRNAAPMCELLAFPAGTQSFDNRVEMEHRSRWANHENLLSMNGPCTCSSSRKGHNRSRCNSGSSEQLEKRLPKQNEDCPNGFQDKYTSI